jgi:hypothetical protein
MSSAPAATFTGDSTTADCVNVDNLQPNCRGTPWDVAELVELAQPSARTAKGRPAVSSMQPEGASKMESRREAFVHPVVPPCPKEIDPRGGSWRRGALNESGGHATLMDFHSSSLCSRGSISRPEELTGSLRSNNV